MQQALADHATAVALASLRDLEGFVTRERLMRPREALVKFAAEYLREFDAASLASIPEQFPDPTTARLEAVRRVIVGYDTAASDPTLHRIAGLMDWGIAALKHAAELAVLRLSTEQRCRFLTRTSWRDVEDAELDARGFGAWPTGEPAHLPAEPDEVRSVSLKGDKRAVYYCLTIAGTDALAWPWLWQVVVEWRAAIGAGHAGASDKLKGIGHALAAITGRGRTKSPEILERDRVIQRLRPELKAFFQRLRREPKAAVPAELVDALNHALRLSGSSPGIPAPRVAKWLRDAAGGSSPARAADRVLSRAWRIDAESVRKIAQEKKS